VNCMQITCAASRSGQEVSISKTILVTIRSEQCIHGHTTPHKAGNRSEQSWSPAPFCFPCIT
jgi:hypothetical protein